MAKGSKAEVIVVGAGPVGLTAALYVHGGDKVCHWNAGVVLSVAV